MVSPAFARLALGILGNVISLFLFLSPVPTFLRICKKGSVEQYSPAPYLVTFMNCMFWSMYGLPFVHPNSLLLLTITGSGCLIELAYLLLFIIYSDKKTKLMVSLATLAEVVVAAIVATFVLTLTHTTTRRSQIIGFFGIVTAIVMYAAPLSVMKSVIKAKSVEFMPLSLSVASFANGVIWTLYAIRPFDPYVATPNGLGSLFALAQLILYATYYKSTKEQIAARKVKVEMALAEVVVVARDSSKVNTVPQNVDSTPQTDDT